MRFTSFTDYSLRVLMYLAARPDSSATIGGIAAAYDVKENHLSKVVHFLGREGFIITTRGKGGGLKLARPASDIVVGAVVRRAEGESFPVECFAEGQPACRIAPVCKLANVMQQAVDAMFAVLDRYTLADITANREQLAGILFLQPVT